MMRAAALRMYCIVGLRRVDPLRPEGHGFESRSSRHARRDLGQVLHLQFLAALRRVNSDTLSIAVVGSASERLVRKNRYRNE